MQSKSEPPAKSERLVSMLDGQPVIPVIGIDDAAKAPALAHALLAGGLRAIEITLRTPAALDAIRRASGEVEGAIVGAGTILNARQFEAAVGAGARFVVSPGLTADLADAAADSDVPLLPGAVTPGEIMAALDRGLDFLKFFPAEQAGGVRFLEALAAPFAAARFCPTGGIGPANAAAWLSLPNVVCVGGSWVVPKDMVGAGDWASITTLAREAGKLRQPT